MSAEYIIRHSAPTLAGLKTGNLFPCSFDDRKAFQEDLRQINRVLVPRGLRLIPLRMEENKALKDELTARRTMFRWLTRYNTKRRHSWCRYQSPNTYERTYTDKLALAA